jgi:hypothetical protein
MKKLFLELTLLAFISLFFLTCKHDPYYLNDPEPIISTNCSPDTVYFVNDVLPLLQSSCALSGCHDASSAQSRVIMTDYVNIVQTGHVKPGNPKSSRLYKVITGKGEEDMPPSPQSPMTSQQTDLIYKWIDQGAWNLQCLLEDCDTNIFTFSGAVWPVIQNTCLGCHSGNNPGAGIFLTDYQSISAIAADPRFMGAITHTAPYIFMPQNSNQLSDCRITQFRKWIAAGMPDN